MIHEDETLRQLLTALVNDRYRSVTAAAPEELGSLITLESFDMMIAPRSVINSPAEKAGDPGMAERVTTVVTVIIGPAKLYRAHHRGNLFAPVIDQGRSVTSRAI